MSLAALRIGLLTAAASRAGGGVFEAVARQAALIRDAGGDPHVFALDDPHAAADRARFGTTPVTLCPVSGPAQIGYAPRLGEALRRADLDVLHLHGIWMYPSRAGARWATSTRRPYLVSPHGMLDSWITARGRWKKALARRGYERASWRGATALHALTDDEADDIARETGRRDSLVIPNAAPPAASPDVAPRARSLLYIGRIHPKKNLHALLDAWRSIAPGWPDAALVIAGWGDAGDVAALRTAIAVAGPSVRFVGPAHGADKARLLAEARFAVLPSLSEGLPMAVLEAWAAGLPTVMTPACHLPDGFATGAALPCGDTAATIAPALAAALGMADDEWRTRASAARALATGPFSPASVARAWVDAYARLAGRA